jgi:hypothetical protein
VLTEFASVDDILSFGLILAAVLSMHDPYPEYSPPEVDDKHLTPEVDPAVYPICAGKWQLAPHSQLLLPEHEIEDVSTVLQTFLNDEEPKASSRDIAYSERSTIEDSDNFAYVHHSTSTLRNGFTSHFVCASDLASKNRSNPDRNPRARPGRIPRKGNPRIRVDCGGSVAISVTTNGIGINYNHRPIHQRAAVRRVGEELKDLIRTKQFASARELR